MKELVFADWWYYFLIAAVICYLIGCFNFAVLISHFKKRDIREEGSGNPGTMNMTRTFGLKIGAINFFCDVIKGGAPVIVGYFLFKDYVFSGTTVLVSDFARYFFGIFVIIGHIFPVFLKFKGGKGIASTMGMFSFALLCENPWYFLIAVVLLFGVLAYIAFTEWGSMGSLLGVSLLTVFQAVIFVVRYGDIISEDWVIILFMLLFAVNLLTWIAHNKNIYKLLAGEEHRTSVKSKAKKKRKKSCAE